MGQIFGVRRASAPRLRGWRTVPGGHVTGPLCDVGVVCAGGTCQIPDPSKCH
jgi:hypothetical protein